MSMKFPTCAKCGSCGFVLNQVVVEKYEVNGITGDGEPLCCSDYDYREPSKVIESWVECKGCGETYRSRVNVTATAVRVKAPMV
jgi:hypothetical protein